MANETKKSVAVWQPFFFGGGAEAVALWVLEALHHEYDVTLFTLSEVDFSWLNAMYATQLSDKEITVKAQLPERLKKWAHTLISDNKIARMAFIYWTIREFKKSAYQYDVVFSAFNGLDMGRPGIQYLHWVHVIEKKFPKAQPWLKALMVWADFSHERLCENFSIANSEYTAEQVQQCYGIEADVVFPPVVTQINTLPWSEKENAFLCSGRVVKAKQTHRVINILKAVRDKGFDIKLHITGGGGGVYGRGYLKQIEALAQQNSDWIYLHQNLPYDDYLKIVSRCRYGIHYKTEPFGISVAEMLKADMIPFVRSNGGQREIVGAEHQDILFANEAEGIEKIVRVLGDEDLKMHLLQSLKQRKDLFSTERFMDEIRETVKKYFDRLEQKAAVPAQK
ncbi:MAG: glycosyltransferase family 4 protein [Leptolyngbya sp. SIO1E4]|nr:glycosyltransferase family 4 protein [Leptolyngbya sp. SIO1E4]